MWFTRTSARRLLVTTGKSRMNTLNNAGPYTSRKKIRIIQPKICASSRGAVLIMVIATSMPLCFSLPVTMFSCGCSGLTSSSSPNQSKKDFSSFSAGGAGSCMVMLSLNSSISVTTSPAILGSECIHLPAGSASSNPKKVKGATSKTMSTAADKDGGT